MKKSLIITISLVAVAALVAVFVLVGTVSARAVVDKGGPHKRVIAHSEEEVSKAVSINTLIWLNFSVTSCRSLHFNKSIYPSSQRFLCFESS